MRRVCLSDYEQINRLFIDTVHTINAPDYTHMQRDIWAPQDRLAAYWIERCVDHYVLVAQMQGLIIGFASIVLSRAYLDHLFVHKDFQRMGIATALVGSLESFAREQGVKFIECQSSITALPFFEKQGFLIVCKQEKLYQGTVFVNYLMRKALVA